MKDSIILEPGDIIEFSIPIVRALASVDINEIRKQLEDQGVFDAITIEVTINGRLLGEVHVYLRPRVRAPYFMLDFEVKPATQERKLIALSKTYFYEHIKTKHIQGLWKIVRDVYRQIQESR